MTTDSQLCCCTVILLFNVGKLGGGTLKLGGSVISKSWEGIGGDGPIFRFVLLGVGVVGMKLEAPDWGTGMFDCREELIWVLELFEFRLFWLHTTGGSGGGGGHAAFGMGGGGGGGHEGFGPTKRTCWGLE